MNHIGHKIKELRKKKGFTQEKLAEYLNLSCQAVSKWETGIASPDVSQIPALCHIFGVSSDTLLGIDIEKNDEEIRKILCEANDLGNSGKGAERTALLREANLKFPRNFKIMLKLADSLVCEYSRNGTKDYTEVFELCNKILAECTESNIRYETIDTLAVAYGYAGKNEEMLKLAEEMPRAHFSYENFMLYRWKGNCDFNVRQQYISYLINQLIAVIGCAAGHLGDNGKTIYSGEERFELNKLQVELLELLFPDKDYQYMAQEGEIACKFIALWFVRNNDIESALEWLRKAVDFAIHMDTYDFDAPHTSLILRGYSDGGWIVGTEGKHLQSLLKWLNDNDEFDTLRSDLRYLKLVEFVDMTNL